ncbi:hypothetical protein JGUZn3_19370 [Entomobacter blattae]|uniref:Uncharacterized protein n=1 Tax=Entomobacter blattae TaxID=2762277 RepID=A0A7H1NTP0_9PROT|nr:hypothetical protein JGUZn3_19370 [Entomobacter blattae]
MQDRPIKAFLGRKGFFSNFKKENLQTSSVLRNCEPTLSCEVKEKTHLVF